MPNFEHSASACHGYHRLNCKQNAGRANRAVQLALKKELQRLNLSVVDNDHELRQRFAHKNKIENPTLVQQEQI